jgi:hypothetical protein
MSFAEFVDANGVECRLCKFFAKNPQVELDIDSVLDSGKPAKHLSLIAAFLVKDHNVTFTADYVQKHYNRHKEKA